MLLTSKNVLVFAATGAIAGEVARTFAKEGANVWLLGRNAATLEELASSIKAAGGKAIFDIVDATDEKAVTAYVARVAETAGHLDVVFNGIGGRPVDLGYPTPVATLSLEQFMIPLQVILGSTFLTSKAVGAYMVKQGSGSIVTLTATLRKMTASIWQE